MTVTGGRGLRAAAGYPIALETMLQAVPFACAAFAAGDGALVASNGLYRQEFGALTGHDRRDALLDSLRTSGIDIDAGREVRAPHNGRWYSLYWRVMEQDGVALSLLTAVDISESIEVLDSHKSR